MMPVHAIIEPNDYGQIIMRAHALAKIFLKLVFVTSSWYPCASMAQAHQSIDIFQLQPPPRDLTQSIDIFQLPPAPLDLPTQNGKPCKGSVKKGLKAYNEGNYPLALCHWLPAARNGDLVAQNNMGVLFENGLTANTPRSIDQAAGWYVLAARQNYIPAIHNMVRVQTALGYNDLAAGWSAMAQSLQQQQANQLEAQQREQSESAALIAYFAICATVGCAPTNSATATALPRKAPPPKCQISPYQKDILGNPAIICE